MIVEPAQQLELVPRFTEPDQPDLMPIMLLHRGHNGYVSFHRKDEQGEHQDLFSVPARTLDGVFPQLSPLLETDAYFSINGFWRAGWGAARNAPEGTNLKRAHRIGGDVRWLTCCFADIDCHSLGIEVGTAIGHIINAQDAGLTPPASMLTRSGRGVWAFWFLADGDGLQRAFPERVQLWCKLQTVIGHRFAYLGTDAKARDVSRITRIAGSINSKSASKVAYWVQHNSAGKKYTYSLSELATTLGVELPKNHPAIERTVSKFTQRAQKGARARWVKDLDRFRRLEEMRGTWKPGTRNGAAFVLVSILRSLKGEVALPDDAIEIEARKMFNRCQLVAGEEKPFSWREVQALLRTTKSKTRRPLSHQTIADRLDVTPEESPIVGWPASTRFGVQRVEEIYKLTRPEQRSKRRELLQQLITTNGDKVPTAAACSEYLETLGVDATAMTILADLRAIGHESPRSKKVRRRVRTKNVRKLFSE